MRKTDPYKPIREVHDEYRKDREEIYTDELINDAAKKMAKKAEEVIMFGDMRYAPAKIGGFEQIKMLRGLWTE